MDEARGIRAAVLTVSDGVVDGTRADRSGDGLARRLTDAGFGEVLRGVVPDEVPQIAAGLRGLAAQADLVLTTGGTGLGPRDVTPEATLEVVERLVPGLAEAMRAAGRISTPRADLSRSVAGTIGASLVVNLPGSSRGALESLDAILPIVPHALDLLAGHTVHGPDPGDGHGHEHPHQSGHDHADHAARGDGHDRHRATDGRPEHPPEPVGGGTGQRVGDPARGHGSTDVATAPATSVHAELNRRRQAGEEVVLATAIRTTGSPPCRPGQQVLLAATGPVAGTLGCAEFDAAAASDATDVLAAPEPLLRTYGHADGDIEVHLHAVRPAPPLIVLGATPVATWLLRWGRDLGYAPVLVEARTERVTEDLRAAAGRVVADPAELELRDGATAVHTDHEAPDTTDSLAVLAAGGAGTVWLMGGRRHASAHLDRLAAAGIDPTRVRTPAGLDIGGRSPQEIALSILAGIVAEHHGRPGGYLDADPS